MSFSQAVKLLVSGTLVFSWQPQVKLDTALPAPSGNNRLQEFSHALRIFFPGL